MTTMFEQLSDDDRLLRQQVRETENEIVREAFGETEEADDSHQIMDELSQTEAWDGGDLTMAEIANRNMRGDDPNNFDRPVQLSEEMQLVYENARLREQNASYEDTIRKNVFPELQAAERQKVIDRLYDQYGVLATGDDAQTDRFLNELSTVLQTNGDLHMDRVNQSLAMAHRKYGKDFENVYREVTSMNPASPLSREIAKSIYGAADPGEALMLHHDSAVVASLRTPPPFLAGPRNAPPAFVNKPRRAQREASPNDDGWNAGFGDPDVENDIANSIWSNF